MRQVAIVTNEIEFELVLVAICSYQSSIAEREDGFLNMRLERWPFGNNDSQFFVPDTDKR